MRMRINNSKVGVANRSHELVLLSKQSSYVNIAI